MVAVGFARDEIDRQTQLALAIHQVGGGPLRKALLGIRHTHRTSCGEVAFTSHDQELPEGEQCRFTLLPKAGRRGSHISGLLSVHREQDRVPEGIPEILPGVIRDNPGLTEAFILRDFDPEPGWEPVALTPVFAHGDLRRDEHDGVDPALRAQIHLEPLANFRRRRGFGMDSDGLAGGLTAGFGKHRKLPLQPISFIQQTPQARVDRRGKLFSGCPRGRPGAMDQHQDTPDEDGPTDPWHTSRQREAMLEAGLVTNKPVHPGPRKILKPARRG